jgi:hypothetical protein
VINNDARIKHGQHNNECLELGIELKTRQADLHPSDTMPAEYITFLSEEKLYKDTWQHHNVRSGLDLYEIFKMCDENETRYMFGQECHVAHPVFRAHKYLPLFLCVP